MMSNLNQPRRIPRSPSSAPLPKCAYFPDLTKSTASGNSHSQLSGCPLPPASLPLPPRLPLFRSLYLALGR
jgi:hypothetical protein